MRSLRLSCLAVPALVAASPPVLAPLPMEVVASIAAMSSSAAMSGSPAMTGSATTPSSSPTPTSALYDKPDFNELKREIAASAVTTAATQMGTVTTEWVESTIDFTTTWVEMIYTQTFASVPDQWSTSGSGSIGLGTISGTVGIVKDSKSGAVALLPSGTFVTVALGVVGVITGVGMIML